jgi:integrase
MPQTDLLTLDLDKLPLMPRRWMHVLSLILHLHNWQHSAKSKGVSHRTNQARARLCVWVFRFLRDNPTKRFTLDPRTFSGRHAELVLTHWRDEARAGRLSPATLPTYYSHLKTFTRWIGKPDLLKPMAQYFGDSSLYARSGLATSDKSWRALGLDVERVIADVEHHDAHAAACLWLMRAFGLRFKESLMLRPHLDVVHVDQMKRGQVQGPATESPTELYLDTHRGTKGGRQRFIPIDSDVRRRALDYARSVVKNPQASVSNPCLGLQQAMRHLRYVMERFGVTKRDLGVVPHGLRHEFASTEYTQRTATKPPVAGGRPVDRDSDMRARTAVSALLGHGRIQITGAYLGQSAVMRRKPALRASGASEVASDST